MSTVDKIEIGHRVRDARIGRGWSQEYLGGIVGAGQSTIDRIERGDWKRLPSVMARIAHTLELPLVEALGLPPLTEIEMQKNGLEIRGVLREEVPTFNERQMPIFGSAEGGDGALILSAEPIDMMRRPTHLAAARLPYAVRITGTSMIPAFHPDDLALVNPNLEPIADDIVILQREDHGTKYGIIKSFISRTMNDWRLRQFNPKRVLTRSRKEWPTCHVVVGRHWRR
jgi:phage repressor protein C with HTH and peptisase S24 domain